MTRVPQPGFGPQEEREDPFSLNREIAYLGRIGRQRREFCAKYIEHKIAVFKQLEHRQAELAAEERKAIACSKGCSYCCNEYVPASVHECEAIVYHLYQKDDILDAFRQVFPQWWDEVKRTDEHDHHGRLLSRLLRLSKQMVSIGPTNMDQQESIEYEEALSDYIAKEIPCPFLVNAQCSIYEVRPWACAAAFALKGEEWCKQPYNLLIFLHGEYNVNRSQLQIDLYGERRPQLQKEEFFRNIFMHYADFPFYYGSRVFAYDVMPRMVYDLLQYGLSSVKWIRGLESLDVDFVNDSEVKFKLG